MKKIKISFTLNVTIFILVTIATIFMFTGFHFMTDDLLLEAKGIELFKFFTVDSNLIIGIMSLLFAYFEYQIIKGKRKNIPSKLYIIKYIATIGVLLTFLVTVLYLAPFSPKGFFSMFQNSNLFFHLIIPILSLITFVFFEKTDKIKFKHTFLSLIPTLAYSIFYVAIILTHLEDGKIALTYDWYGFAQGGLKVAILVFIFIQVATYIVGLSIWFLNRRKAK